MDEQYPSETRPGAGPSSPDGPMPSGPGRRVSLADRRAVLAAAADVLRDMPQELWQAGGADLGALRGELDQVTALASGARVAVTAEALERGEVASSQCANTAAWVGAHAPSLAAGPGARQVAALVDQTRKPSLRPVRDAAIAGDLAVPVGLVVLAEFDRLKDRIVEEAQPLVLDGLISIGTAAGPRGAQAAPGAAGPLRRPRRTTGRPRPGRRPRCPLPADKHRRRVVAVQTHRRRRSQSHHRSRHRAPSPRQPPPTVSATPARPQNAAARRWSKYAGGSMPPPKPPDPSADTPRQPLKAPLGTAAATDHSSAADDPDPDTSTGAPADSTDITDGADFTDSADFTDGGDASSAPPGPPTPDPSARSPEKRDPDLIDPAAIRAALAGIGAGGGKAILLLTMTLADLQRRTGAATTLGSVDAPTLIAPDTARRIACDAGLIPVVLGTHGEILDLGRTHRLFTPAQTRALLLRDRHCTFPGCNIPGFWTDVHHLRHWVDGGASDLSNAALLCRRHHTIVHRDRLAASVTTTGVHWDTTPRSYDDAHARDHPAA